MLLFLMASGGSSTGKAEAYRNGIIHHMHMCIVQFTHVFPQASLVDGPNLFQKDYRILAQTHAATGNIDVSWKPGLSGLAGNGRRNDRRAVTVSGIILNDQYRPNTTLFTAHHRGEIGIVNIAALDTRIHKVHTPPKEVPVTGTPVRPLSFSHAALKFILC